MAILIYLGKSTGDNEKSNQDEWSPHYNFIHFPTVLAGVSGLKINAFTFLSIISTAAEAFTVILDVANVANAHVTGINEST